MTWGLRLRTYGAPSSGWEDITHIVRGLILRAGLPGGLQTIQFDIADDYLDAYRWAYDHIGADIFVFDNAVSPPVAQGVIMEPGISQDGNRIIADGPYQALCFRQAYNDTASWTAAGQTGAQIQDMLTTECPGVNANQDNMDEPGTNNFPWQPSKNDYPGDIIPGLVAMSDPSNNDWHFWLASAPMSGTTPNEPIPWLKTAANIPGLYQCWRRDMAPGGLRLTPSLRDLVNDVQVPYRDSAGSPGQTASAVDAASQARYWLREGWKSDLGYATAAAAAQYRDLLLAEGKDAQQSASFKLNTRVYDQWGGRWPLWRLIADFPVKFTVNDLLPDDVVLGHTLDKKRTFITLAAEYNHDNSTLTIVPDTEDNRADVMLARYRALA